MRTHSLDEIPELIISELFNPIERSKILIQLNKMETPCQINTVAKWIKQSPEIAQEHLRFLADRDVLTEGPSGYFQYGENQFGQMIKGVVEVFLQQQGVSAQTLARLFSYESLTIFSLLADGSTIELDYDDTIELHPPQEEDSSQIDN